MKFLKRAIQHACSPMPFRATLFRRLLARYPFGSFEYRLNCGGFHRPWYAWCLFHAAVEAKALGHKAFTAIELGVAGGNGLITLCDYRDQIEKELGIEIVVLGLDAGSGLPPSSDSRDILYCWPAGSFEMDFPKLQRRLNGRAEIVLGDVATTAKEVNVRPDAPLGAILFDLDLYTSTRDSFALLSHPNTLPRVMCYFDDISGEAYQAYSDFTGVRAAIADFNQSRSPLDGHLSRAYAFSQIPPEQWHESIYIYHNMKHPDYSRCLEDHKHTLDLH